MYVCVSVLFQQAVSSCHIQLKTAPWQWQKFEKKKVKKCEKKKKKTIKLNALIKTQNSAQALAKTKAKK